MTTHGQAIDQAAEVAPPARKVVKVTSAQIAAAQLQMSIDRKFGRKTPEIVKKIAAAK